jgi:hypothetical protein
MKNKIILDIAKQFMLMHLDVNDTVVDATMGRGNDTLFLANHVKKVISFDIQEEALLSTKQLLDEHHIENVELILDSHENIDLYVDNFKGVVFNLGYLPKGNKAITTEANVTILTLNKILSMLPIGGFILYVVYIGHQKGIEEAIALESYLETLNQNQFQVLKVSLPYQQNKPPYILFIHKKDHNL